MHIPMRWGTNPNRKEEEGIRHSTPAPHSLDIRASWASPKDRWWRGGHAMKRSQRQRRRDVRRGIA